jgi:lipopolysaccharide heptosyltransferase II
LIQITKAPASSHADSGDADKAALGALVKFGSRKRRVIRAVEALLRPVVSLLDGFQSDLASAPGGEVRKILVVEYWNLGDMVMQSPFLINLRVQYPQAHITLLTSPKVVPLIANQGLVDDIVEVRVPWAQHYSRLRKYNPFSPLWLELHRTLRHLRAEHFDLAFSARADLRDNFILWFSNARRRVAYSFGGGGFFLTDRVTPDIRNPHFSNRWLRLLEHLGKPIHDRQPRLHISDEARQSASKLLQEHGVRSGDFLVGVHPGARSVNRQWGADNFTEVAERLLEKHPIKVIWFQEPGQEATSPPGNRVLPLSLKLNEFMAVLAECGAFICNDSGPMHIATALGVPVVAVFGPTEPAWFGPQGPNNQIVIRSGFWCRPCFDYCIFDQPYCLRTISIQDVFQAADKALSTLLTSPETEKRPTVIKKVPQIQRAL